MKDIETIEHSKFALIKLIRWNVELN